MKKSTKFLTVFLLALLGANLQPMWADKITSTTWACLRGTFYTNDWGDIGMTNQGTDYYTGTAYIVAGRNVSFKLKAGGNGPWESMYGLSGDQTYNKDNTDKSGWYSSGNNVNLNIMSAASGWVKIDYAFWGDYYGNSRVTITQSEYKSFSLKHLWPDYENWGYMSLNIDNGDGTFSVDAYLRDADKGFNWHLDSDSGDRELIEGSDITKVGNPVENDYCRFTFNPKTLKITITRYMQVKFMNESTEVSSVNVLYNGSTTTPSAPSKIGYRFLGWSKDGGSNIVAAGETISNVTADATYEAQWEIKRYKAIYDANGVSGYTGELPETVEYDYGAQVTISQEPKLSKYGYTFIGWNTDPNATTALPDNYRFTIDKGDTKIYAIWDAVKPTSIAIVPESGSNSPNKGTTTQMIATLTPDASTMAEENRALTWSSSDATRAFINQKGQVSFVGTGDVTITATANVDNNVKGNYTFHVQAGNCDGLKIHAFGDGYEEDDYFHPIYSGATEWRCPYVLKNGADKFWVGDCNGWQEGHSQDQSFNDIPLRDYRNVKTNPAQDLVGTLVIWNNSGDKNYYICFEPTYQVSYMTDASTWRIMELYPTSDTYAYETELLQVPEGYKNNANMKYFVGLKKADGTNVSIYNKSREDAINGVKGLKDADMAGKFGKWHISSNSGDMNWYCVFNQYYRLSYAGEGTDEYQPHDVLSGGTKEQRTIKLGAVPEKKGYTPKGWLIKGTLYDANSDYEIVDDAVAEAQWDPIVIKLPEDEGRDIPQYVCDLTMQEGSELENNSITIMRKFEYIRRVDALDRWETFAMPVDVMKIHVKDGENYYDIWPAYGSDNAGYFYMKTLAQVPEGEFQSSWEHIQEQYPGKGVPFIIQYPTSSSDGYFADKEISYICEIEDKEGITINDHEIETGPYRAKADGREFKFCANTNLTPKQLDEKKAAYILTESGTCFDLVYGATIPPFSGYIIATEKVMAKCPRMMLVSNGETTDLIPIYTKPNINAENRKIMVNGQIFIYHAGKIYNLTGSEIY